VDPYSLAFVYEREERTREGDREEEKVIGRGMVPPPSKKEGSEREREGLSWPSLTAACSLYGAGWQEDRPSFLVSTLLPSRP